MSVELLSAAETSDETDYVARVRALAPLIAEAASDVEAGRRLDDAVVAALHDAGLFRMMMPALARRRRGAPVGVRAGDRNDRPGRCEHGLVPVADDRVLAGLGLSRTRGGPGGVRRQSRGARLGLDAGREGGARAGRLSGYREMGVRQRLPSRDLARRAISPSSSRTGRRCCGDDGEPLERTMLFPKAAARIADVWHVLGLRGTGSDLYTLDDHFIPEEHTITSLFRWPDAPRLKLDVPYRFGGSSLYASGFACVALGNARGMLDGFIELSKRKVPRWGKNPLADNMIVQVAVAECDTKLASALVYLVQNLREVEAAAARRQDGPTMDERMKIRAAGTYALRLATGVVNQLYEMAGTTAIFDGNPFERRFRDAHTISQHAQGRISHMETVGKHLLGIEQVPRFV